MAVVINGSGTVSGLTAQASDIELTDDTKIKVGDSDDLQIYHDGSHSYIKDAGTGNLRLMGTELSLRSESTNEPYINCTENGSVRLYHDNSVKLETTSTGVDITGSVTCNGLTSDEDISLGDYDYLKIGAGDDFKIWHDGTATRMSNTTGNLNIRSAYFAVSNVADNKTSIYGNPEGEARLYHNNTIRLETTSGGATVTGTLQATSFSGDGSSLTNLPAAGETAAAWCSVYWNESIYESYNVSSITDVSAGKHYVNFDTDLSNSNYAIGGTGESNDCHIYHVTGKTTSQYLVWTTNGGNNTRYDTNSSSIVFGD